MDSQVIAIIITSIFSAGASWAILNERVKSLEDKAKHNEDHNQRIARLETKIDILIATLMKQ